MSSRGLSSATAAKPAAGAATLAAGRVGVKPLPRPLPVALREKPPANPEVMPVGAATVSVGASVRARFTGAAPLASGLRFSADSRPSLTLCSSRMVSWILAWSLRRRSSSSSLSRCAWDARNFSISSAIICSRDAGAAEAGSAAPPPNSFSRAASTGARRFEDEANCWSFLSFSSSAGVRVAAATAVAGAPMVAPAARAARCFLATSSSMTACSFLPTLTRIFWSSSAKSFSNFTAWSAPSADAKVQNPKALAAPVSESMVRFHFRTGPHCVRSASTHESCTSSGSLPTKTFMGEAVCSDATGVAAGAAGAAQRGLANAAAASSAAGAWPWARR
mmetsp:Transcript_4820/g.14306  ORF Transcript_4820/g.14306 Transcript_4820/m.14306 type:complete len:334 (+) Transcript_4820:547-1548(+)